MTRLVIIGRKECLEQCENQSPRYFGNPDWPEDDPYCAQKEAFVFALPYRGADCVEFQDKRSRVARVIRYIWFFVFVIAAYVSIVFYRKGW